LLLLLLAAAVPCCCCSLLLLLTHKWFVKIVHNLNNWAEESILKIQLKWIKKFTPLFIHLKAAQCRMDGP